MRRVFYDLEIRAKRVEADIDYINIKPIDKDHSVGFKIVIDSTLATHGTDAKAIIVDQMFKALDEYFTKS